MGVAEPGLDLVHERRHPQAEERLNKSADVFSELGDWGGLGWAFGLLAFVRYNQGRLAEAAALAEHIAIDGRETGNRWAVGMMSVLLGNVRLWSGQMHDSLDARPERSRCSRRSAIGGARSWLPVRSYARSPSSAATPSTPTTLAHYRTISRDMPDEGMRMFPEILESLVDLQQGRPEAAQAILDTLDFDADDDSGQLGFADGCAAIGFALLQLGKVDDAIDVLARGYAGATRRRSGDVDRLPARARVRGRAPHRRRRARDRRDAATRPAARSPIASSRSGPRAWCAPSSAPPDARGPIDAAYEIAMATDAPLEHAIAALARAKVLAALGHRRRRRRRRRSRDASSKRSASPADGWSAIFDLALAEVSVPS